MAQTEPSQNAEKGLANPSYSDIRVRKVKILQGQARKAAEAKGYKPDDLVILKTSEYHSEPTYEVERIEGDPIGYLTKQKAKTGQEHKRPTRPRSNNRNSR